jgi:hypothetical protein
LCVCVYIYKVSDAESKTPATVRFVKTERFRSDTPVIVPTAGRRAQMQFLSSMKAPRVAQRGIASAHRARRCRLALRASIGRAVLHSLRENAPHVLSRVQVGNSARVVVV